MSEIPDWSPPDVDTKRPSIARIYDYILGGDHNFAADREVAERLSELTPVVVETARANREFLRRAVSYLVGEGIEQFLDIGSGIPTVGNVHETAQTANPAARVVYVDIDPVAVAHSRLLLEGNDQAAVVRADIRDIDSLLKNGELLRLIDFTEPVGVLIVALLHFVSDEEDPGGIVRRIAHAVTPGSHLVISHLTEDGQPEEYRAARSEYTRTTAPTTTRSHAEITALFGGFDLIEPGLVHLPLWRPDDPAHPVDSPERHAGYAGVGRKK